MITGYLSLTLVRSISHENLDIEVNFSDFYRIHIYARMRRIVKYIDLLICL